MGALTPEQLTPQVSSLIQSHPNPYDTNTGEDSPADQKSKFMGAVESSFSTPQCLGFESEEVLSASVSSSDNDLLYEGLQRVQISCNKPNKRSSRRSRKSCRSGSTENSSEKRGENVCSGRQACNCVASFAGDCAAVSCCPCAILHLFVLAFVVVPSVFASRVFHYVKRNARRNRELRQCKTNEEDETERPRYYTPPWSCTQSPRRSGALDGPLAPKFDTQKVWWELYAAGHMGFGGLPFEMD